MNTKVYVLFIVLVVLILSPVRAAAEVPAQPRSQGAENAMSVTFANLGYTDSELVGPLDATRKTFSVPINWLLKSNGTITLNYNVIVTGADAGLVEGDSGAYAGTLTVSFNNLILGVVRLGISGSETATFTIPKEAVTSIRDSGQHELTVQLNAQLDCLYDVRTSVTLFDSSSFDLAFDIVSPELNLSRLPSPFFLRNSLLPNSTLLVVPSEATAEELEAALDVMAGFGSLVERPYNFYLITDENLTPELIASNHLIFVSMPEKLPILEQVNFPVPVTGGGFVGLPQNTAEDGILQMALSPWNPDKVVLLVSGNSGAAVIKAAQAVGSGKIFIHENPAVAYIRDVQTLSGSLPVVEDFTLADLGYDNEMITGVGVEQADYTFYASKEQLESKDGLLTLVYYHSGLLDYGVSSLAVEINGQIISSVPFKKETEQITSLEIKIPQGVLRYGENVLTVQAGMQADFSCDFSGFSDPWLMVSNQTSLHLPIAEVGAEENSYQIDLKNFPAMFKNTSDLSDIAFVLAENDPAGWRVAADLAYNLGSTTTPTISRLTVSFANSVSNEARSNSSLIIVGKASDLPILDEINPSLLAPFNRETNVAEEKGMQIVYRIPPNVSVGYLELTKSPFNPKAVVMVVSGNTDEGMAMAGSALLLEQLKDQLTGFFAITNGIQVDVSSDIAHFSNVGEAIPGSERVVLTPIPTVDVTELPAAEMTGPVWLLPLIIATGVILIVILSIVAVGSFRKNKTLQFDVLSESDPEQIDKSTDENK